MTQKPKLFKKVKIKRNKPQDPLFLFKKQKLCPRDYFKLKKYQVKEQYRGKNKFQFHGKDIQNLVTDGLILKVFFNNKKVKKIKKIK